MQSVALFLLKQKHARMLSGASKNNRFTSKNSAFACLHSQLCFDVFA
jgi:hypothetical protein